MDPKHSKTSQSLPAPRLRPPLQPVRVPRPGRPWTIVDLEGLADDENHYELVRGDLLMWTPTSPTHGRFVARLLAALGAHVAEHDLGEVFTAEPGFQLEPEPNAVVRAPDAAFISKARIPAKKDEAGFWPIAPDLAIEVISPSESASEIRAKLDDYLAAGVRLIWVVYPTPETVEEFRGKDGKRLGKSDVLEGGDVVPGFSYRVASLFR